MGNDGQAESLRTLADHLTDVVWRIDPLSQGIYGNEHWRSFAGVTEKVGADPVPFPPSAYVHAEDIDHLNALWGAAVRARCEFSVELRLLRACDSSYIWHKMRFWPVAADDWMAIGTEIHTLKAVQDMFQLVMDNIPISIFWKDLNSNYLGCNRLFASHVGVQTTEELVGRNDYDNPSTRAQSDFFRACDRRVMESGMPEYHIIEPQQRPGGKQAWLDTNKIPLRDAGGTVFGVLGMYEDITARVILEQQREDFVATLTHDLKNPLIGSNRVLEYVADGKLGEVNEQQRNVLNQIREANLSLLEMIQNLLDIYRYDSSSGVLASEEVDLNDVLSLVVERNRITAQDKNIHFSLSLPETPTACQVRRQDVGRVLQNLIDNALKFTQRDGRVEVSLTDLGNYVRIEVKDDGPGIELEEQLQLFGRFWQGRPGKKFSNGTGLGLYLCKQIVEAHKGKITCDSLPGQGATFVVILPRDLLQVG
ncbi:MAG: PAS domain-containing sensor histidine kinase [Cyanobacteria bacterium SZAS TMP-1]|nr:PAS domain-containing sensor histidine kinase [Cyanobacteria bacterium SZAS TMP-1]